MPVAALILVEPAQPGNLGAVLRVAANFGVAAVELVRPRIDPDDPEVAAWACGGDALLRVRQHQDLARAAAGYRTLVGTSSGRGRNKLPVIGPRELAHEVARRGRSDLALLLGNETTGLKRHHLDRCDLVVRVPTRPELPVLNLAQSAAILLGYLAVELELEAEADAGPTPATLAEVDHLVDHLRTSLTAIGFLDPVNPDRILRKLRRLLGRAGVTSNEVNILRGMCSQIDWAASQLPKPE
jgi:TrmH family RNA methyltransferase